MRPQCAFLHRGRRWVFGILALLFLCLSATSFIIGAEEAPKRVLKVGRGQVYAVPSQAAAVAKDGDIIEIVAGHYFSDVAVWTANDLTLRSVGGVVHIDAGGKSAQNKAIWVIQGNNTTIANIEFSGCRVLDKNGAAIRQEGTGLIVTGCSFHDNENGILAGDNPESDIVIERSEFCRNGHGDGLSHNLYIGRVHSLALIACSSHHANIGHAVKSRAETNFIIANRLMDEANGRSSYLIHLPNGGKSFIIGNIIQHGPQAENGTAISYADEGAKNPLQELYVVNNTFVNERKQGGKCLRVAGEKPVVKVVNNLCTGATDILDGPGDQSHNLVTDAPSFVDAARYDYHLTATSPAIGGGVVPEKTDGFSLAPLFQYLHPLNREARPPSDHPDLGAYQFVPPPPVKKAVEG